MTCHLIEKQVLLRANVAVALTAVWGGLGACAIAASVYDIGRWIQAW